MSKKKRGNKKGKSSETPYFLGRLSNQLRVGIVGYPNIGKSTLFNAMTHNNVPAENYPFCTRGEHLGVCEVPDERLTFLSKLFQPPRTIPSVLNVVDIAGLVRGASQGEGLGNEFLSYVRGCDALYHLVRVFKKKNIAHHEGSVDPIRDIDSINFELRQKDIQFLEKTEAELIRPAKGSKEKAFELDLARKVLDLLKRDKPVDVRFCVWQRKEIDMLNIWQLLTAKPQTYLANLSPKDYRSGKNKNFKKIVEYVKEIGHGIEEVIPFSALFESKIEKLAPEKLDAFCKEMDCYSAIPRIISGGYSLLRLHSFFSHNEKELRSWTIRIGTNCQKAAGRIHGDFERTFICAEVYKFDDIKEHGSESELRAKGMIKVMGKAYIVEDGDIIFFKAGCMKGN